MSSAEAAPAASVAVVDASASAAAGATTSASVAEKNKSMKKQYRHKRCPRWRLRQDPAAPRGRPKTLLYDGDGPPFEKAVETRDGIVVWMRASPGAPVKEVLAECTFHGTHRDKLWRAIGDVHRYGEFVPFVRKCEVVKRDTTHKWVYNVVKPPMASPRDYTIKIESNHSKGGNTAHVSRWTIDNDPGPKAPRGTIRLIQNKGSWELKEAGPGGGSTALRYRILTDPGASLPGWLIDIANQTSVPDVLRAFHKRANSGIYEREDIERAEEEAAARQQRGRGVGIGVSGGLFSIAAGTQGASGGSPMRYAWRMK